MGIKGRGELHIPDLIREGGRRGGYILIFEGAYYRRQAQWCTDQRYVSQAHLLDQAIAPGASVSVEAPQPEQGRKTRRRPQGGTEVCVLCVPWIEPKMLNVNRAQKNQMTYFPNRFARHERVHF